MKKIKVILSGGGSEFNQGFISKIDYNRWLDLKQEINWEEFCRDHLELDGYWEVSDVASFTAINKDLVNIQILVNDINFYNGSYWDLREKYFSENEEISNSKNISLEYGKSYIPVDWEVFFNTHSFNSRDKVLVTTITSEYFKVSSVFDITTDFDINKLGFNEISTDETGYGIDYGDFLLNVRYEDINVDIEYPGGVGQLDTPRFN